MPKGLGRRPGRGSKQAKANRQAYNQQMQNLGALANNPMYANQANQGYLQSEQQRLQNRIARRQAAGKKTGNAERKLAQIQQGLESTQQYADTQNQFQAQQENSMNAVGGVLDRVNQQGAFEPQNYMDSRQKAYDVAMGEFNRTQQPQFQLQEDQLRERLVNQGHDPTSELFQREMSNLRESQGGQRQSAMANAFQLGQSEQGQAYNQQYQTYMAPTTQAQALNPYYSQNLGQNQFDSQQQFLGQQAGLDRQQQSALAAQQHKYNMALQSAAPGPAGPAGYQGMPLDQQLQLADRNFYNQMVLQGMQQGNAPQQPGVGGGFAQGFGVGVGAGLGSGLR